MSKFSKQILFVGESQTVQSRLQTQLERLNSGWYGAFARAGADALAVLKKVRFDAVVANDLLPDMDGFAFLNTVQDQHPDLHRFIVCDLADSRSALKTTRLAHHCVPKPWDIDTIHSVLERTFDLSVWLS